MKMKVVLTPNEVEQIVREHLMKTFDTVGEIKIEVGQESRGSYMHERQESVFKGITCEVEA